MGSIIIALLVFSFLILTHELGHFLFAKKCGIGVVEFSLGMGPRILSKQIGETRYSIKAVPFGGSCAMVGEDTDDSAENAFNRKSVWARILVVAGGPLFNLITAFILSVIILACIGTNPAMVYRLDNNSGSAWEVQVGDRILSINGHRVHNGRSIELYLLEHPLDGSDVEICYEREGVKYTATASPARDVYRLGVSYYADESDPVLTDVAAGSGAEAAGLMAGDRIRKIQGQEITQGVEIQNYFAENPIGEDPITIVYERDGQETEVSVIPVHARLNNLDFQAYYYREASGPIGIISGAYWEMDYWLRYMVMSLKMIVTGQVSSDDVSGPVGIVSTISDTVETSSQDGIFYVLVNLMNLSVLLSVNLGIMNLLPVPALDGGRLLFLFVEVIRGKPISPDKEGVVHMIGFALLMVLMVFVMYHDIVRLIAG